MKSVSISKGNSKMGAVPSVSLPPIVTCKDANGNPPPCAAKCYAAKLCRLRKTVREAYARNLEIWTADPATYELQVKAAASMTRFFRWHVSGDLISMDYLKMVVRVARELPHTEFLMFTKRFDLVNDFTYCEDIPGNLHIIFSAWPGMDTPNPHDYPVAHVVFRGEEPADSWKVCGGNCTECACRGVGCWQLKHGEHICFNEH